MYVYTHTKKKRYVHVPRTLTYVNTLLMDAQGKRGEGGGMRGSEKLESKKKTKGRESDALPLISPSPSLSPPPKKEAHIYAHTPKHTHTRTINREHVHTHTIFVKWNTHTPVLSSNALFLFLYIRTIIPKIIKCTVFFFSKYVHTRHQV